MYQAAKIKYRRMIVTGELTTAGCCKQQKACRCHTEGATLSGQMTVTGRTSGETVKAPKGQVSFKRGIISQAKGQSKHILRKSNMLFRGQIMGLTFLYYLEQHHGDEGSANTLKIQP